MYIFWTVLVAIFTFIAGLTYGRMVGIDAMLHLGAEVYPDFKKKITDYVIKRDSK